MKSIIPRALVAALVPLLLGLGLIETATARPSASGVIRTLDLSKVKRVRMRFPDSTFRPTEFRVEGRAPGWVVRIPTGKLPEDEERVLLMPVPSATVVDGRVFAGGGFYSRELHALDAASGRRHWSAALGDHGPSAIAVSRYGVTVNTESCTTVTLDPRSGALTWSRNLGPSIQGIPTVVGGESVVVGARLKEGGYALISMSLESSLVQWSLPIERDVVGAPIAHGGRIYVTLDNREVHCVSERGERIWKKNLSATCAPWLEKGALYVATNRSPAELLRVDARDGSVMWKAAIPPVATRETPGGLASAETLSRIPPVEPWGWGDDAPRPVVRRGALYFARGLELVVVDVRDGSVLRRHRLPRGRFHAPPAMLDDRLLLATLDGLVLEIDPRSGKVHQGLDLGVRFTSQPVVAKGRVHLTSWDLVYGIPWKGAEKVAWTQWGGGPSRTGTH